jgi:hypothetical protein
MAEANTGGGDGSKLRVGRGMDIGTCNLISAVGHEDGSVTIRSQRNAFIDVEINDFTKKMLTKLNVQWVKQNNRFYVLGDAAFELANIFNREMRRPMAKGMISPNEVDALPIVKMLVSQVIGEPSADKERVYYSVPAQPIDTDMNVIYHKDIFDGLLRRLNYNPKPIEEGHTVIFSDLADEDFTGIGISFGAGMANLCVAYKTVPCLAFSTSRGGDWIDNNAAMVLGWKAARVTAIKEKGIDLMDPRGREEEAIIIYYRNLINYTLTNIKARFESASSMPTFSDPVSIVCCGGASRAKNFITLFKDELKKLEFPIAIKDVRLAADPLNAVAQGCLIAAQTEE